MTTGVALGGGAAGVATKAAPLLSRAATVAERCLPNSFTPDTEVLLADGTRKRIRDLRVSDRVLATDPESGLTEAKAVVATIEGTGVKDLVDITIDTGGDRGAVTITATDGHPFWLPDQRIWLDVGSLRPGDRLGTSTGVEVRVSAVPAHTETGTVHNLTVGDIHTYYVFAGDTPVIVHNCGISMDGALTRAIAHVGEHAKVVRSGSGGVQFMSSSTALPY